MKRSLFAVLVLGLWAGSAAAQLRVFSCEPEWAELARVIGGAHVEAFSATTAEQDVHFIQARPSLIAKLRNADLLVCTGAGLESGWLPVLRRRANNPAIVAGAPGYVDVSQWVMLLDQRAVADRAEGDVHPEGNPHFHLDPRNFIPIADRLAEKLAALDAEHADDYRASAERFKQSWQQSISDWEVATTDLRGTRVVAHHLDWNYLADWLGLEIAAMLEPKPGVPPSTRHLSQLLINLASKPADCIVRTRYQDARPSEWLSKRAGIPALVVPHTVGGTEQTATLHGWFDAVIQGISEHCR